MKFKIGQYVKIVDYEYKPFKYIGMIGKVISVGDHYIQIALGDRRFLFNSNEIELFDLSIFEQLGD